MGDGSGGDGGGGSGGIGSDAAAQGADASVSAPAADAGLGTGIGEGFGAAADAAAAAAAVSGLASGVGSLGDASGFGGIGTGTGDASAGALGSFGGFGGVSGVASEGPSDSSGNSQGSGLGGFGFGSEGGGLGGVGTAGGIGGFGGFSAPGGFGNTGISAPSDSGFGNISGIGPSAAAMGLGPSDSLGVSSNAAQAALSTDVGTALGTLSAPDPTSVTAQSEDASPASFAGRQGSFSTNSLGVSAPDTSTAPGVSAITAAMNDSLGTQAPAPAPPSVGITAPPTSMDADLGITDPSQAIANVPASMSIPGAVAAPVGYGLQAAAPTSAPSQDAMSENPSLSESVNATSTQAKDATSQNFGYQALADAMTAAGLGPSSTAGTLGIGSDATAAPSQPGISTSPATSFGLQSDPTAAEDAAALAEANQQAIALGYMNPDGTTGKDATTTTQSLNSPQQATPANIALQEMSPQIDAMLSGVQSPAVSTGNLGGVGSNTGSTAGGGGNGAGDQSPDWNAILGQPATTTTPEIQTPAPTTQTPTISAPFVDQTPPPVVPPGQMNPAGGPGNPTIGNQYEFANLLARYPDLRNALIQWSRGVQT